MPRVKPLTEQERLNQAFLKALGGGQKASGDKDVNTATRLKSAGGCGRSTYYKRLKAPGRFTVDDIRAIHRLYTLSPAQVCAFIGIPYDG